MTDPQVKPRPERHGSDAEPAWDIARIFPNQGAWSEEEYLSTNRGVEFIRGRVEVLAVPSIAHQDILFFVARALARFVEARQLGKVLPAGTRVRTLGGHYREPDVSLLLAEHADRADLLYWAGADLVVEVVSPDDPKRDLVIKRREYAEAGIPEYWIVDPREEHVIVLGLEDKATVYSEVGTYVRGATARSRLLDGFEIEVAAVFDAAAI